MTEEERGKRFPRRNERSGKRDRHRKAQDPSEAGPARQVVVIERVALEPRRGERVGGREEGGERRTQRVHFP